MQKLFSPAATAAAAAGCTRDHGRTGGRGGAGGRGLSLPADFATACPQPLSPAGAGRLPGAAAAARRARVAALDGEIEQLRLREARLWADLRMRTAAAARRAREAAERERARAEAHGTAGRLAARQVRAAHDAARAAADAAASAAAAAADAVRVEADEEAGAEVEDHGVRNWELKRQLWEVLGPETRGRYTSAQRREALAATAWLRRIEEAEAKVGARDRR
jgi:hypothetical protein